MLLVSGNPFAVETAEVPDAGSERKGEEQHEAVVGPFIAEQPDECNAYDDEGKNANPGDSHVAEPS